MAEQDWADRKAKDIIWQGPGYANFPSTFAQALREARAAALEEAACLMDNHAKGCRYTIEMNADHISIQDHEDLCHEAKLFDDKAAGVRALKEKA